MQNNLKQRYQTACEIYINQEKSKEEVIGIIVCGSFVYAQIDKNSDIDIHVILHPDCTYRERGNTWINGIEIEYFKNPPQQIRSYLKHEKSGHTAHMLTHGRIVYQDSLEIEQLKKEATNIMALSSKLMKPFELELGKYFVDDMYKDFEDAQLNGDKFGTQLIKYQIINKIIDLFCAIHQIKRPKHKRLLKQLESIDVIFVRLLNEAMNSDWNAREAMSNLRANIEQKLGGRRTKEWILKSPLDL